MDRSSADIAREIVETRDDMGGRLIELRRRGEVTVRRTARVAVIAAAVGAGIGAAAVTAFILYKVTRPPTARERIDRLVPKALVARFEDLVDTARGLRSNMPALRLYVNDKAVHEEPKSSTTQKILLRGAQAAGTALAGALATRIFGKATGRAA